MPIWRIIAPWWFDVVRRNDIAWTISGLLLGGPCWYALMFTCGVAVARLERLYDWDIHADWAWPSRNYYPMGDVKNKRLEDG